MRSGVSDYIASFRKRGVDAAILGVSLVASAKLLSLFGMAGDRPWVTWYALLPLFVAIRVCRPAGCLLAGGVWGGSLCCFAVSSPGIGVPSAMGPALLLTAMPALYALFGGLLTRWMGFSPFVLGIAWVGVEFILSPLGFSRGLLGAAESETPALHWIACALGYVHVALLAALFNAWVVKILAGVRIPAGQAAPTFRRCRRPGFAFPSQFIFSSLLLIEGTRPRGPPLGAS